MNLNERTQKLNDLRRQLDEIERGLRDVKLDTSLSLVRQLKARAHELQVAIRRLERVGR